MMRILTLCHEYPPIGGGAAAVCDALDRRYVQRGCAVTAVTMGMAGLRRRQVVGGVRLHRVECGRRSRLMATPLEGLRWAQAAWPWVQALHRRRPFDAVHAHFIMPAGILAHRLKRVYGVPYVLTPHGSDVPGYNRERLAFAHMMARPWWLRIVNDADTLISPSAELLARVQKHTVNCRGMVIPNGFDPTRFRPLAKERRILLCGRLVARKRFDALLRAAADLDAPGWRIDIVGDGPQRPKLAQIAERSRIPVTMHGWIDNDHALLAELHGKAMIYAFPSERENFPIALLEAVSAGCAVLSTEVSGSREALGDDGVFVPPGDDAALRCGLEMLIADPQRCGDMGRRAAERANRLFNWQVISDRYLAELERVAGRKREEPACASV